MLIFFLLLVVVCDVFHRLIVAVRGFSFKLLSVLSLRQLLFLLLGVVIFTVALLGAGDILRQVVKAKSGDFLWSFSLDGRSRD